MTRHLLFFLFSFYGTYNHSDLHFNRQRMVELLFSILIISILVTAAIPTLLDCRLRAKLTHVTGEINKETDMYVYHAINGTWPQDKKELEIFQSEQGFNLPDIKDEGTNKSYYVENIEINNGAFHILLKEELAGKTLSIRPAVPDMDPTGPVILLCKKEKPGWNITGIDRTDVDDRLISKFLKQ